MSSTKYAFPDFLLGKCTEEAYSKWLARKARAHVNRDRERGNDSISNQQYKIAIHNAVIESRGLDAYTGRHLRWDLVSKYDNEKSKSGGRKYRRGLSDLPTVDHINDFRGKPEFNICSMQINDAKSDLTLDEFIALCKDVLRFNAKTSI